MTIDPQPSPTEGSPPDPLVAGAVDVAALTTFLRAFAQERDWEQFHTPKNLAMALTGEVGELIELLQWRSDEEIIDLLDSPNERRAIADELADVLIYLVRLADVVDIDLDEAVRTKMAANAVRYDATEYRGSARKAPHD